MIFSGILSLLPEVSENLKNRDVFCDDVGDGDDNDDGSDHGVFIILNNLKSNYKSYWTRKGY